MSPGQARSIHFDHADHQLRFRRLQLRDLCGCDAGLAVSGPAPLVANSKNAPGHVGGSPVARSSDAVGFVAEVRAASAATALLESVTLEVRDMKRFAGPFVFLLLLCLVAYPQVRKPKPYPPPGPIGTASQFVSILVDAGVDQTTIETNATLVGTATLTGAAAYLTTIWSVVSGPTNVVAFDDPTSLTAVVYLPVDGAYVFRLTAAYGPYSNSDEMIVVRTSSSGDYPPMIECPIADRVTPEDTPLAFTFWVWDEMDPVVRLSMSAEWSPVMSIHGMSWSTIGTNKLAVIQPMPNANGAVAIKFIVYDSLMQSASCTFNLTITPVNDPPTIANPFADMTMSEDTTSAVQGFTIYDVESGWTLGVNAVSSDTAVIANSGIAITSGGTGQRGIRLTPVGNANGASTITVTVDDGTNYTADGFTATVTPVNDAPTITEIADRGGPVGVAIGPLAFTIYDVETPGASLILSKSSTNTTVLPLANVVLAGSGTNRTVVVTPAAVGTSEVGLTVADGTNAASTAFLVTGVATNTPPTISAIPDQSMLQDSTKIVGFTIGDLEDAAAALVMTGTSSDPFLLGAPVYGGVGANRTVSLTPTPGQSGTTIIESIVTDTGGLQATTPFTLTVIPVNTLPVIGTIPAQSTSEDTPLTVTGIYINDAETPPASLTFVATSSNQGIVTDANLVEGGSGTNRSITITPSLNANGNLTITATMGDGTGTTNRTFSLAVNPVNDLPSISAVANQTINEDEQTTTLNFTVGDVETPAATLAVTGLSSSTTLVPNNPANIVLGGSGSARTVRIIPAANQNGTTTITLTVSDGTGSTNTAFNLTVTAVNDRPTITDIADTSAVVSSPAVSAFTIGDVETPTAGLTVTRSTSNPAVVPLANAVLGGGTGANRTITCTPIDIGYSLITVTVSDGALSTNDTFYVTGINPSGPTTWWVSAAAVGLGDGSYANPWTLSQGLAAGNGVAAGDAVVIRGGVYPATGANPSQRLWRCYLNGQPGNLVTVSNAWIERPIIRGGLLFQGTYTRFYGIEFAESSPDRYHVYQGSALEDAGIQLGNSEAGIHVGNELVNCVIHDRATSAIRAFRQSQRCKLIGNIVFYNGFKCTDTTVGSGVGMYLQTCGYTIHNDYGYDVGHNIVFQNYNDAWQASGGDNSVHADHLRVTNNITFCSALIDPVRFALQPENKYGLASENLIQPPGNSTQFDYRDNVAIRTHTPDNFWAFIGGKVDSTVANRGPLYASNNVFVGFTQIFPKWTAVQFVTNVVYRINSAQNMFAYGVPAGISTVDYNEYYASVGGAGYFVPGGSWATWQGYGFDAHGSLYTGASKPPNRYKFHKNPVDAKRGHLAVLNFDGTQSVTFDPSPVLAVADTYEIRCVQNLFGTPIQTGTYAGGNLTVNFAGCATSATAVNVATTPEHLPGGYHVFVVRATPNEWP